MIQSGEYEYSSAPTKSGNLQSVNQRKLVGGEGAGERRPGGCGGTLGTVDWGRVGSSKVRWSPA